MEIDYSTILTLLAPLVNIADAYETNGLDETRPEWQANGVEEFNKDKELYTGRGGKSLLTLKHALDAKEFVQSLTSIHLSNQITVDGIKDSKRDITYIGNATKMEDGTWRCLANVEGQLAVVEVSINFNKEKKSSIFTCSFCGKTSNECEILIAGPLVNICNECVEAAQQCINDLRNERKVDLIRFVDRPECICQIEDIEKYPNCPARNRTGICSCYKDNYLGKI
jgi:hypothetical protein